MAAGRRFCLAWRMGGEDDEQDGCRSMGNGAISGGSFRVVNYRGIR
jgi:hypothetical protein